LLQRAGHLRRRADRDLAGRRIHPTGDPIVKSLALTAGVLANIFRPQLRTNRKA
jgi:hypothetical protein